MIDKAKFFHHLRQNPNLFGRALDQHEVEGAEAVLDACIEYGCDIGQTAYCLSTAYGETGGDMTPKRENMNYSAKRIPQVFGSHRRQGISIAKLANNPVLLANTVYGGEWGWRNLGNTEPNDGWNLRGWGIGQWTGRRNTLKVARDTGLDLLNNPDLLDDIGLNAEVLVRWMMLGKATGKKLPDYIKGDKKDYMGARKVWGGVEPRKYVGFAKEFERALKAGNYAKSQNGPTMRMNTTSGVLIPESPTTLPTNPLSGPQSEKKGGLFASLVGLFKGENT